MLVGDCTCSMAKDSVAGLQSRGRWAPTSVQSIAKQFVSVWLMRPHDDRRDGSESRGIETQEHFAERKDHVMGVLVLRHDLGD
jgi:hypothetical protein